MTLRNDQKPADMPPRFSTPSWFAGLVLLLFFFLFFQGFSTAEISPERLLRGMRNLVVFVGQAIPPDWSNMDVIANAMVETLYMAIVGVTFGVLLSIPFALLASRNTTPHPMIRVLARFLIATMRTIPDLIWALIFVVAVGLGPLAGILAIILDTIGFAARFFSERIEEVSPGPSNALTASGAGRLSVIMGAILPETLASMSATSLYSVEKAIRSAVTLGLVGAGGIGVELATAMRLFQYDKACAIILVVLVVVIGFEQLSSVIRKKVI